MRTDYLVIGTGVAGLTFALEAAERGKVTAITKAKDPYTTSTEKAQGGIAAVLSKDDSFALHMEDTLRAGSYLNDRAAVESIVRNGPDRIDWLIETGARFTKKKGDGYDLTREAAHSRRRIIRAEDMTGKEVERALLDAAYSNKDIDILTDQIAVDLVLKDKRCAGAYVLDKKKNEVNAIEARATVLATGGCGKVYLYTSNPDIATGDGLAIAYWAGAPIANMEFIQFHPTCLYNPEAKNFLISEAVRGEGAKLVNKKGKRFCDPLAPRDEVARAIYRELKRTGDDCVYLDMKHLNKRLDIRERFPGIYSECLKYKIDITKDLIPVVPAAHYCCGGVKTNVNGETKIKNLFAVGEVACTGLHGANRLASNSLLEALVCGKNAAWTAADLIKEKHRHIEPWYSTAKSFDKKDAALLNEDSLIDSSWDEIRRLMWNYVGIVRTDDMLDGAKRRIVNLNKEINGYYFDFEISPDLIELRNIATVAEIIIDSARKRKESVGLHYTRSHPERSANSKVYNTIRKRSRE